MLLTFGRRDLFLGFKLTQGEKFQILCRSKFVEELQISNKFYLMFLH